jgi:hypothetical protein
MAGEASAPSEPYARSTNQQVPATSPEADKPTSSACSFGKVASNNASGLLVSLMSAMKLGSLLNLLFG